MSHPVSVSGAGVEEDTVSVVAGAEVAGTLLRVVSVAPGRDSGCTGVVAGALCCCDPTRANGKYAQREAIV